MHNAADPIGAAGPQTEKQFDAQEEREKASQQELESVRCSLQTQLEAEKASFQSQLEAEKTLSLNFQEQI